MQPILVIDDDPGVREALDQALSLEGWPVVGVPDGWEGVDWLLLNRPSLVLLDWGLPDFDGGVVATTLHHTYGDTVPLVLVTGNGDHVSEKAVAMGAFDYLEKPFEVDVLYQMVRRAMTKVGLRP